MSLVIDFEIKQEGLREKAQVLAAFQRDGVQDVCRILTRDLLFDWFEQKTGSIRMSIPKLMLADGQYSISLMLAKEGYYDHEQTVFYSINPGVYTCLNRFLDIFVIEAGYVASGTCFIGEAEWSIVKPRHSGTTTHSGGNA